MITEQFKYSPDCIELYNDTIIISFYELFKDGHYEGGMVSCSLDEEKSSLNKISFVPLTGVFDFKIEGN